MYKARVFINNKGIRRYGVTRNGKIIFVEKKPASVPEGLKLAYPDLNERRILVQSGSEYAVFDCGKTSTLTYEQKARELVATTAKNAKRYCDFLNEVSNVVWSACKGNIDNVRKTLKEFDVMRTNVAARTTFDIGFLGDLEKKCGKWDTALDNGYWGLVRDTMKVEGRVRRPVALKPAANAPELGSEFADWTLRPSERTHDVVEWAKPLAGGRKKVFITVNGHGEMDAWQLAKRMDMDAAIFTATGEEGSIGVTSDYFNEGFWYTPKKRQELERALKEKGPFDAFVFIGTRIGTWPAELQCWLYERMLEGAQVIEKNGGGSPAFAKMTGNEELAKGSPKGFKRLVNVDSGAFDWKLEPVPLSRGPLKSQAFGKGGYSTLSTDWASAWYYAVKGSPAWPGLPEHVFQDEYGFAYLVRNVMQVLGLRDGRRAVERGNLLALRLVGPLGRLKRPQLKAEGLLPGARRTGGAERQRLGHDAPLLERRQLHLRQHLRAEVLDGRLGAVLVEAEGPPVIPRQLLAPDGRGIKFDRREAELLRLERRRPVGVGGRRRGEKALRRVGHDARPRTPRPRAEACPERIAAAAARAGADGSTRTSPRSRRSAACARGPHPWRG
mgnify:CR=1 FL=1